MQNTENYAYSYTARTILKWKIVRRFFDERSLDDESVKTIIVLTVNGDYS